MSKTLLLADDSVTIQKVVGISFASEDVNLLTVDNGDDAIAKAREVRPDLVLADVVMPGKNGYEVCAAIKADPELRHVPVILLTGTFEAFDEERAQQVGAASHVAKPFEAQTLVDEVRRLLSAPPPVAEPARPPAAEPMLADADLRADRSSGDSFDFFDDDLAELSVPARRPGDSAPPNTLDLEHDAVFAFGQEDSPTAVEAGGESFEEPSPLASVPSDTLAGDRTVAILPEEDVGMGLPEEDAGMGLPEEGAGMGLPEEDVGMGLAEPAELLVSAPSETGIDQADLGPFAPEPPPPLHREPEIRPQSRPPARPEPAGLDFDLEPAQGDAGLVDATHITQEAVVDPKGVSGFAISSSDLGDSLGETPVPPTAAIRPPPAPTVDLAETAPRTVGPLPALQAEPIDDAEPLDEAMSVGEPADELPPASADAALDAIAPQLREQLHDTLEKIAWESFSDVTEKIVRQAVERVEQIAWEVIPHMAETLVREEIRRMKGEK
jgi:CheY-like chemotaxis protein